jgi:diamine N-acetyltransferase
MELTLLKGTNVQLRPVEIGDLEFIYALESDPENWKVSNTLFPYSKFQVEQYILNTQHDIFAEKQLRMMIDRISGDDKPVRAGMIDLFDLDPVHRRAAAGILVTKEEQHRGVASEALSLLTGYCFSTLNLHQVHCSITAGNEASIRLFTKHGFAPCGVRKDWRLAAGQWTDRHLRSDR